MEITRIVAKDLPKIETVEINNESCIGNKPAQIKLIDCMGRVLCTITAKRESEKAPDGIKYSVVKFEITPEIRSDIEIKIETDFRTK